MWYIILEAHVSQTRVAISTQIICRTGHALSLLYKVVELKGGFLYYGNVAFLLIVSPGADVTGSVHAAARMRRAAMHIKAIHIKGWSHH